VPATFFVIGKNGDAYPDILRRIVNEGHEVGNHTYTHPNLGEVPAGITTLELNANQRLIESVTGRSTVLFRRLTLVMPKPISRRSRSPPSSRRTRLHHGRRAYRPGRLEAHRHRERDCPKHDRPREDDNPETRGQIVLLHDSGGDRSATIAALPELIHQLRARGKKFVLVSELEVGVAIR
jgi:peptidoglycan/xylan/chitin deacetylase (PgdA/CDA1 family)